MGKNNQVVVEQLTVNYDKTPVLWDISFEVPQGQLVAIIGPNGAGKSTLIKAVLGLVEPLSGKVTFDGQKLLDVQKKIAYIPQKETIDWDFPLTVEDLVLMGRYGRLGIFKRPRAADKEAALASLEKVGMLPFKDRQINQLSGGQKQRVFLARAIAQDADYYFLDEPFSGIDHTSEKVIMGLLKELVAKGKTIFVVHHDLPDIEAHFDWVIMLNLRLSASGPVKEVYNADNLELTYGRSYHLLDDVMKLSKKTKEGYGDTAT
ncbi:MAG: metal ABC transporter ATP-binding protein [Chlamydiia bacterium]|nr:metal ABC transporter ATP-binding protein [Chlamydiia bacterium]